MEDKIYKWIYDWVAENFGESEADDPSWDIHALAEELDKHRFEIYCDVEHEKLEEDCEAVAEEMGVELTDKQKSAIIDAFECGEQYVDRPTHIWTEIIKYELKKGENNE